jgi:hypothetical protein
MAGLTASLLLGSCSEPPPPPPKPKPKQVKVEKPKSRSPQELMQALGIDPRIHLDEAMGHDDESVMAASLLLANAMLNGDDELALTLTASDQGMQGMLDNPLFVERMDEVDRIDLEFGRIQGDDGVLMIWEFPEALSVQMWAIAGPVPKAEQAFFWTSFSNDSYTPNDIDTTAETAWTWDDGMQVAFLATPSLPGMIDLLGEDPFHDWTRIVESWDREAKKPDLILKIIDAGADDAPDEADESTGRSGFRGGGGGPGGGPRPG